jgi:hypothetical protein
MPLQLCTCYEEPQNPTSACSDACLSHTPVHNAPLSQPQVKITLSLSRVTSKPHHPILPRPQSRQDPVTAQDQQICRVCVSPAVTQRRPHFQRMLPERSGAGAGPPSSRQREVGAQVALGPCDPLSTKLSTLSSQARSGRRAPAKPQPLRSRSHRPPKSPSEDPSSTPSPAQPWPRILQPKARLGPRPPSPELPTPRPGAPGSLHPPSPGPGPGAEPRTQEKSAAAAGMGAAAEAHGWRSMQARSAVASGRGWRGAESGGAGRGW